MSNNLEKDVKNSQCKSGGGSSKGNQAAATRVNIGNPRPTKYSNKGTTKSTVDFGTPRIIHEGTEDGE